MSTISKEHLRERAREKVNGLEYALKHPVAFADTLTEIEEELELARIALASLEAEDVYQYWCYTTVENSEGDQEEFWFWNDCDKDWFDRIDCKKRMLFTAPPVPVSVPGDVTAEDCPAFIKYDLTEVDEAWARGFNACRAAMLQGADGALTNEDTKRVGELVMWVKRLAHSLRKDNPDSKLQSDAMDYLSRKGLIGVEDVLR